MTQTFEPGDIVWVCFPRSVPPGREQQGRRPAFLVSDPSETHEQRFRTLIVIPLSSRLEQFEAENPLYPRISDEYLPKESVVMLDHVRSIDLDRVDGLVCTLPPGITQEIKQALTEMLKLD